MRNPCSANVLCVGQNLREMADFGSVFDFPTLAKEGKWITEHRRHEGTKQGMPNAQLGETRAKAKFLQTQ